MKRTTEWTCDVCGKIEFVNSDKDDNGLSLPIDWDMKWIALNDSKDTHSYWQRQVVICKVCWREYLELNVRLPESREALKKPFWKKLLRGEL